MKRILLSICCFFIAGSYGASAQSAAVEKVMALEKQRFAAMVSGDTVFLHTVLADDLLYSHSNGVVDTKASLIRSIVSNTLDYQEMNLQNMESRTYKGTVILNGTMNIKLLSNGQTLDLKIKYLDVYRKKGKAWQLVAWQSAKLN